LKFIPGLTFDSGLASGIGAALEALAADAAGAADAAPSCRVVCPEQAPRSIITAASVVDFQPFITLPPSPATGCRKRLRDVFAGSR
jgi:hypothetical protein